MSHLDSDAHSIFYLLAQHLSLQESRGVIFLLQFPSASQQLPLPWLPSSSATPSFSPQQEQVSISGCGLGLAQQLSWQSSCLSGATFLAGLGPCMRSWEQHLSPSGLTGLQQDGYNLCLRNRTLYLSNDIQRTFVSRDASHLHCPADLHSSFSRQHSQRSRYCSPNSASPPVRGTRQSEQQPPSNSGSRTHVIILYASRAKRKPSTSDVALSIHHPPFHRRKTRLPTNRTMVICIQDNEHAASPAIVLLLRARARYRFGSQMRIMITSALAEMIRDAVDESGSRWSARFTMAVISVARASKASRMPIPHVPILSTLHVHQFKWVPPAK